MSDTMTRQQVIDNLEMAIKNLLNLLPETIAYHPDTQFLVEELPTDTQTKTFRFTANIVVSIDKENGAQS